MLPACYSWPCFYKTATILILWNLTSFFAGKAFSIDSYVHDYWLDQYKGWQQGKCRACASWLDTMVKTVLSNMEKGVPLDRAGGMSNGQVVRFAASLGVEETEEGLVRVARETTQFTNRNPQPIAASEFWARTVHRVINGAELEEAINGAAAATNDSFITEKVKQAIAKVKEATDESSSLSKEEFVDDLALTRWRKSQTDACSAVPALHAPLSCPTGCSRLDHLAVLNCGRILISDA